MADIFGRESELARIDQALARACAGRGSLVLVTGEPGIGKSSVGREVAARAGIAGMAVLSGRCWEGGGAAPYWPWVQVFRGLGATPFEELAREDGGDSQQRRFQLFDAATRALTTGATKQPLLVFLDDLHAADLASVLLLLFLSRQISASRLFVLGTFRDVETRLSPEVADALAKVGREGEVMSLARLTRDDVAAWIANKGGLVSKADDVHRITEGNPLFVHEVLRAGAHGGMPAERRHQRRPRRAPAQALAGGARVARSRRRHRSRLRIARAGGSHRRRSRCRARAPAAGRRTSGCWRRPSESGFSSPTFCCGIAFTRPCAPSDRSALHWKTGLVVEAHGADPTRVANHLLEGAGAGDAERAAASALLAAQQALARLAFEAGAELAARGLTLLGAAPSRLACQLEIVCGEGLMRSGSIDAGRARCVRAADMAKTLGYADEQARAALVYGSEVAQVRSVNAEMVRLLEDALSAVGTGDSALAAKLGARLATALLPPRTQQDVDRIRDVALAALAMARRLNDAETLLYALEHTRNTIGYNMSSDERFEIIREAVTLAQMLDQRLTLMKVAPTYAVSLLERGLRADADATVAALVQLHAALDYPQGRWRLPMLRAGFALFEGRLDEAERLGDEAVALAQRAGWSALPIEWACQRIALAIARSDPASIGPHAAALMSIFERTPFSRPHRAWVLAAVGRREEGLRQLRESSAVPQGLPTLFVAAEACALLEDPEAAASIEEQFRTNTRGLPFFWGGVSAYAFGPTPRARGELARILGRRDEARRYFEESIALCERIGAKTFLDLSVAALARLEGGARPAPDARPRAQPDRPVRRDIQLKREGDVWAVEGSSGAPFRLKDSKGLAYLSELLAHPGQELHVLALVGLDHVAGDAGPVLDARAKAAYKQRLDVLEDEIAEADGFGDEGRANRAREELDALATQLAGAVGLGGRDRRAASDVERARINVQRRLKDTIESVAECDPELGRYLAATVKTGTFCSFTPL